MAQKIKTIILTPREWAATKNGKPARYHVERVTDSLDFIPGELIDAATVLTLCESKQWKVTVRKPK